jgi:hypothetical protein
MLRCRSVAFRTCIVSFKSPSGITHGVDVQAETLYEAAAVGLELLKRDGWIEGLGPSARLGIAVREPGSNHSLTVHQLQRWLNGTASSPADGLRRARLRALLSA